MAERLFTGGGAPRDELVLPPPLDPQLRSNGAYLPSSALRDAVEVALLLGQPLLLTGEPGTGKSTLARAVAHERFGDRILEVQVKSETGRADLLYRMNEMDRFRDAQPGRTPKPLLSYFEIQPFGEAILRACGPDAPLHDRAKRPLTGEEPFLAEIFGPGHAKPPTVRDLLPDAPAFTKPMSWVVLVDEIDKAPRDTPNDLLEEFERMGFTIPELRLSVLPPKGSPRPVVIVTSNSEKSLPDAFLRRCAFHHIGFPEDDDLRDIIRSRVQPLTLPGPRLAELLALFDAFRDALNRRPGTAELLQWIHLANQDATLHAGSKPDCVEGLCRLIGVVAKQEKDIAEAEKAIRVWAKSPGR